MIPGQEEANHLDLPTNSSVVRRPFQAENWDQDVVLSDGNNGSGPSIQSQVPAALTENMHAYTIKTPLNCDTCNITVSDALELRRHIISHGHTCAQCSQSFSNHEDLGYHASDTGHIAYKCHSCDSTFSRRDVMLRHRLKHSTPKIKYSCDHCKKWRAPNGFKRKDHLTQHLRNYHHIDLPNLGNYPRSDTQNPSFRNYCLLHGCALFRSPIDAAEEMALQGNPLFTTRTAFTKHMREHDISIFPCTFAGCKRVNGKGFFQKRAFIKHMKAEHGIDPMAEAEEEVDGATETADQTWMALLLNED